MKKDEFVNELADYCEFGKDVLSLNTPLKDIEGYDSLAVMSMIAFIDENFSKKFTAIQIKDLSDFNSIIKLIGEEQFDND